MLGSKHHKYSVHEKQSSNSHATLCPVRKSSIYASSYSQERIRFVGIEKIESQMPYLSLSRNSKYSAGVNVERTSQA